MLVRSSTIGVRIGGRIVLDPSWWHDKQVCIEENKLFYIIEGELVLRVNGEDTVCGAGEMVLVPAGVCHDYHLSPLGRCQKFWLHFHAKMSLQGAPGLLRIGVPEEDRKKIENRFSRLLGKEEGPAMECKKLAILYEMLAYFLERIDVSWEDDGAGEFAELLDYVDRNLNGDLSLESLAKRVFLSPGYFARRFKAAMGVSPTRYVCTARLECAKEALADSDLSVGEIVRRVGFADAAYFSKNFKRYTGYSPLVYRRLFRE